MKFPDNKEEFLVWPPMGAGILVIVLFTLFDTIDGYTRAYATVEEGYLLAGFLFPLAMGIGLAFPLAGRYWLGFGWLAFLFYLFSLALLLVGLGGQLFVLLFSCALMFATMCAVLYLKRVWQLGHEA